MTHKDQIINVLDDVEDLNAETAARLIRLGRLASTQLARIFTSQSRNQVGRVAAMVVARVASENRSASTSIVPADSSDYHHLILPRTVDSSLSWCILTEGVQCALDIRALRNDGDVSHNHTLLKNNLDKIYLISFSIRYYLLAP